MGGIDDARFKSSLKLGYRERKATLDADEYIILERRTIRFLHVLDPLIALLHIDLSSPSVVHQTCTTPRPKPPMEHEE